MIAALAGSCFDLFDSCSLQDNEKSFALFLCRTLAMPPLNAPRIDLHSHTATRNHSWANDLLRKIGRFWHCARDAIAYDINHNLYVCWCTCDYCCPEFSFHLRKWAKISNKFAAQTNDRLSQPLPYIVCPFETVHTADFICGRLHVSLVVCRMPVLIGSNKPCTSSGICARPRQRVCVYVATARL